MKLEFVSRLGEAFSFTDNDFVHLVNVDGQTSAMSNIASSVISGMDGDSVNSIVAQPRTIILTLRIKEGVNVEEAKREVLKIIKLKQQGSLIWEQNARIVKIDGYVEAVDMPRWTNAVAMQVTLHCSQPFWEDLNVIVQEINNALNLHYFTSTKGDMLWFTESGRALGELDVSKTKTFRNNGDVAVGMEIEIVAFDDVIRKPIIYDQYGNFFGVNIDLLPNDFILINTNKGQKSVKRFSDGLNLLPYIKPMSTWLQLEAGSNTFTIDSDTSNTNHDINMTFNVKFKQRYI